MELAILVGEDVFFNTHEYISPYMLPAAEYLIHC